MNSKRIEKMVAGAPRQWRWRVPPPWSAPCHSSPGLDTSQVKTRRLLSARAQAILARVDRQAAEIAARRKAASFAIAGELSNAQSEITGLRNEPAELAEPTIDVKVARQLANRATE